MKNLTVFAALLFALGCDSSTKVKSNQVQHMSATDSLESLIRTFPDSAPLKYSLIDLYVSNGDFSKAVATADLVIRQNTADPVSWETKASVQFLSADTAGAIRTFQESLASAPDLENQVSLGILYAKTRNANALALADTVLAKYRKDAEKTAYFIKGLYYSFSNQKETSLIYFDSCLSIDHTYMDAYLEKGIALYDMAKFAASADVLKRAVTLQNNFDEGYYYLGRAYEKLGKTADAAEAYETALLYDKDYDEAKEALSRLNKIQKPAP